MVAGTAYAGRRVLGMLDCLWGLLDGINDAGLAVSLTFGGRPQVGEGFGIPLVIRYVLEVCKTTDEAVRALRRIPVHMSYNVTALDRDGRGPRCTWPRTAGPGHRPGRGHQPPGQGGMGAIRRGDPQCRAAGAAEELLPAGADVPGVVAACLRPPMYATRFHEGFGTLYTAEYRPDEGVARFHWPGQTWQHSPVIS